MQGEQAHESIPVGDASRRAARILREARDDILLRWAQHARLLTREVLPGSALTESAVRQEAGALLDELSAHLEAGTPERELTAFRHLVQDGWQYGIRLTDVAYVLLELKCAIERVVCERASGDAEALQLWRLVGEAIDGALRRDVELGEAVGDAGERTAQERLQEIFTAWELEQVIAAAQAPAEMWGLAAGKLGELWDLVTCRCRIANGVAGQWRDMVEGKDLPVPSVLEQRQYLTAQEEAAGSTLDLLERVRRRGESFICADVQADPQVVGGAQLAQAGVTSVACCPLVYREKAMGAMLLYGTRAGVFRAADARRLADLAGVLTLGLDRASRLERSQKAMSEAEVIARIGRAVLEMPEQEALLEAVVGALRQFRDYFDVSLFRVDEQDGCALVAEAGRERRYRPSDCRPGPDEAAILACVGAGKTVRVADLHRNGPRALAFREQYRARSELAVPVKKGDRLLGVMHFLSEREDDFPESEVAALEHVAPHIGVALVNARLMAERQRDRYEIERVHRDLANIMRSAALGIASTDAAGLYTHWSPSCEAMLGHKAEEVVGRKTPADLAAEPYDLGKALAECLRKGQLVSERAVVRKDGARRVIRETAAPLMDEDGRHVGYTACLVDVTEQKFAEERLRRERETLDLVVGAVGAGFALFDGQLRLQWANNTLMQWFGFGPDAVGRKCWEVYRWGKEQEDASPIVVAAKTGKPQTRIQEFTDRAGVWHCCEHVFTPVEHRETRLIVLSLDITEQRQRAEQVRLIDKLTEKVEASLDLDRVLHLVLTCATAGHAIGLNRAFVFLLDADRRELVGEMAVGPVSWPDAQRIWNDLSQRSQSIEQFLDSAAPSEGDRRLTELVRPVRVSVSDTEDVLVRTLNSCSSAYVGDARSEPHISRALAARLGLGEFVCVPLAVEQQPLGVILADNKYSLSPIRPQQVQLLEIFSRQASLAIARARAYDQIRSHLEELQATRDRLIEAERMASVGRMASHLAHEIRNPLTAIGGFARALARQFEGDAGTHRKAMVIYEEARRLERTLANVLDYTRPLRPKKVPISVNDIVLETMEQFKSEVEEGNIAVNLSLAERMHPVLADPAMIKQVVINLVKNAIGAMEQNAERRLSVTTSQEADEVTIVVADNGCGMEQGTMENLFSPFFTTKVGGIGLGLSISQRIVRQHGGAIKSESDVGTGSTFTVTLPVQNTDEGVKGDGPRLQGTQKEEGG